jgi:hypothetical protein
MGAGPLATPPKRHLVVCLAGDESDLSDPKKSVKMFNISQGNYIDKGWDGTAKKIV